jgi:SAM-dependent methyltransferase
LWTEEQHLDYFTRQAQQSNVEFWRRFGTHPDAAGKRVLDLGCGHGAMSLELAEAGGDVLGVDLDDERVSWAKRNVAGRPVTGRMEFQTIDVTTLGLRDEFDLIVSKDTFEHVEDLAGLLVALRDALTPDGELWAGFSPLFYSPWGDHRRTGMRIPWGHALPRSIVLAAASRYQHHRVENLNDIGLNALTPSEFRNYVHSSGLRFRTVAYNRGDKPLLRTLNRLRRIRPLERYATVGVYAVLVRA